MAVIPAFKLPVVEVVIKCPEIPKLNTYDKPQRAFEFFPADCYLYLKKLNTV